MKPPSSLPVAPVVSIVIPVFNKVELTVQCVNALIGVSGRTPYEVIVVDNASTDGTAECLRRCPETVRVLRNERNVGFAKACNQGAEAARSDFVLFLNNDTIPLEGWLEALVLELRRHPAVAAVGSKLLYAGGLVQHAGVAFARETRIPYHPYRYLHADDPRVNRRREMQAVTAACIIIRQDWFNRAGRFNEEFLNGYEDLDLCLNLRRLGGTIIYQPLSALYHLESQTPGRMKHDDRNRALFFKKWRDWLLADEDAYYLQDGSRMLYRSFDGKPGARLVGFENDRERRQWSIVAECQRFAAENQREEVTTRLEAVSEWPADAGIRRWAGVVCRRMGLVDAAVQHWRVGELDEPAAELAVQFADLTSSPDFYSGGARADWLASYAQGFAALSGGMAEFASDGFEEALVKGMPTHAALHLMMRAALRAGDLVAARQTALALLARHRGDPAALEVIAQLVPSAPAPRPQLQQTSRCCEVEAKAGRDAEMASAMRKPASESVPTAALIARGDAVQTNPQAVPTKDGVAANFGSDHIEQGEESLRCSIILLVHNQLELTRKCVESLLAYPEDRCELIFVDNGSSDATPDYLRKLVSARANIRVITNGRNRGFAAGNNQGLAIARGESVVLLNNDTVVTSGWLGRMLKVLREYPQTGVVGPRSNRVLGRQQVEEVAYTSLDELPAFAAAWAAKHAGESRAANRVVGFCLLARREVIEAVGGLDEQFGSGNFEDDDFCIRAHLAGFETRIADDAFVHHVGNATFNGAGIDYARAMQTNWDLFKRKWAIPPETPPVPGYIMPKVLPPGVALKVTLPDLEASHARSPDGRCWNDRGASANDRSPVRKATVAARASTAPRPMAAGDLTAARDLVRQQKLSVAWAATLAAIKLRAFHPEAYLLLAEIAQAAGAGASAQRCVQYVQKTAPKFRPNDPLLKAKFRGNSKPDWLVLPASIQPNGRNEEAEVQRAAEVAELVR